MKSPEEQKLIQERNEEIERAILISRLMDNKDFSAIEEKMDEMEKQFRFQDLLGIKDKSILDEQKGITTGIIAVRQMFKDMKVLATKPRRDPVTGQPEILNKKKK